MGCDVMLVVMFVVEFVAFGLALAVEQLRSTLLFIATITGGFFCIDGSSNTVIGRRNQSERNALLDLKAQLIDPLNQLASWDANISNDCCKWRGVCMMIMKESFVVYLCELLFLATIIGGFFCVDGSSNTVIGRCNQREWNALLDLKAQLTDPLNQLASWDVNGSTDCCKWHGVVCDSLTGHVLQLRVRSLSFEEYFYEHFYNQNDTEEEYMSLKIRGKISSSLLNLKYLRYLDLSNSNFKGIPIPKFLGSMQNLRYLNLSCSGFGGMVPHQLGNISNLLYLNLGCLDSFSESDLQVENFHWLSGLSFLKFLDLSRANLSNALDWLEVTNMLPSLAKLKLRGCQVPHISSHLNSNFSSLTTLDLSQNYFADSSIPNWIFNLEKLVSLDLASNGFHGRISDSLQNMTSLRELFLSDNDFNSSIPNWLGSLNHLEVLELRSNNLEGGIPNEIGNITSLTSLHLSFNNLQGRIPNEIGNITSLTSLDLSSNQLEGGIPSSFQKLCNLRSLGMSRNAMRQEMSEILDILTRQCIFSMLEELDMIDCRLFGQLTERLMQFENLKALHLDDNDLHGSIPLSLGGLRKIKTVSLYNNSFGGDITELHFVNASELQEFDVSDSELTWRVDSDWVPPLQLERLYLSYNHFESQFPSWLRSLKNLRGLGLSNTGISQQIPFWFWDFAPNLEFVDLSHNKINGELKDIKTSGKQGVEVYLNSNCLTGSLPSVSSNIVALNLSKNSLSGSISKFLCNMKEISVMILLNVEENHLSGEIPDCWMNWQNLNILNLGNNSFEGIIPSSLGSLSSIQSLHLENNNLSGNIPLSFKQCSILVSLDLHGNQLSGKIPTWIGKRFSSMVILNLRENRFHSQIPEQLCEISSLHILDLSSNNLVGTIPDCVNKFKGMMIRNDSSGSLDLFANMSMGYILSIEEDMFLMIKGKESGYKSILNLVRSIDLSNNQLCGEIPEEITSLSGLSFLNLSHNMLTGEIPKTIGEMQYIESIDFSQNKLSGTIPLSITNLTFLNHLDVSYNNLSGKIPVGTQLQSFAPSSFIGNNLCGDPIPKKCNEETEKEPSANDKPEINWFYVSMSIGFAVGLWIILGPLLLCRRWRHAYYLFLGRLGEKLGWRFAWLCC